MVILVCDMVVKTQLSQYEPPTEVCSWLLAQTVFLNCENRGSYSYTRKKKISKKLRDLVMACHTPPLEKAKKQGEMPFSVPSHP